MNDQVLFPYNYDEGRIIVLPGDPSLVSRSASGAEVREGGRPEAKPSFQEDLANRGMSMEYARLV